MRFTKFFRRYSRALLMVFMSLLLVTWLITPGSNSGPSRRDDIVIGTSIHGEITSGDWAQAQADQQALSALDSSVMRFDPLDFWLLTKEAQRMGIRVGRAEVQAALAQSGNPQELQRILAGIQKSSRRSTEGLYDLIGRWLAVQKLLGIQEDAIGESAPRIEMAYRDATQKADVQVSVIDSRAFVNGVAEPTEEELQAFFEANKDRFPGHTDDQIEFGYRLPDRVRIEYVTIDPKSLEPKIHARQRELEKYFQENAWNYTKTVTPETQAAGSTPAPTRVPMTFEEAKDLVRKDFIRERAILEAQSLMNQVRDTVYAPWQTQRPDEQGFRPEPEGAPVSFSDLREQFATRAEIIYQQTPLMSQEELRKYFDDRPDFLAKQLADQLGSPEPIYSEGMNRLSASELAFRVKGLYTPQPEERLPVLSLNEPSPVLVTRKTDFSVGMGRPSETPYQPYIFRVVQAEPSAPPASLDEVREQVVADLKLMKAHAAAGEHARQLAEAARNVGLAAAVEQATELKQLLAAAEPTAPAFLSDTPPAPSAYVTELGPAAPLQPVTRASDQLGQYLTDSQKLPREIFEAVEEAGPSSASAHVVVVNDVAKLFKWAVVEVEGLKPVYRGEFDQQRPRLHAMSSQLAAQEVLGGWLSPENIHLRNKFVETRATQPAD